MKINLLRTCWCCARNDVRTAEKCSNNNILANEFEFDSFWMPTGLCKLFTAHSTTHNFTFHITISRFVWCKMSLESFRWDFTHSQRSQHLESLKQTSGEIFASEFHICSKLRRLQNLMTRNFLCSFQVWKEKRENKSQFYLIIICWYVISEYRKMKL